MYGYAEAKGSKCAKPSKSAGMAQIYLDSGIPGSGQVSWGAAATSACNCTKGQLVYNVQGSSNTSVGASGASIAVACNSSTSAFFKTNHGVLKLKSPTNLLSPPVLVFVYTNSKGKTTAYAVLNCPAGASAGGNSSSSVVFSKKAGFNKKWNCGKQQGKKNTKSPPALGSKKGKKYPKVKGISCAGKKSPAFKKCKLASSTSG